MGKAAAKLPTLSPSPPFAWIEIKHKTRVRQRQTNNNVEKEILVLMAEFQDSRTKDSIPVGWVQKGEAYYCPATDQEFQSLDALLRYVSYADARQPELLDTWSGASSPQKKRGRKRKERSTSTCQKDSKDTSSDILYRVRSKQSGEGSKASKIRALILNIKKREESEKRQSVSQMEAQKVAASRLALDSKGSCLIGIKNVPMV